MSMKAKVKFWVQCKNENCRKSVGLDAPRQDMNFVCDECTEKAKRDWRRP